MGVDVIRALGGLPRDNLKVLAVLEKGNEVSGASTSPQRIEFQRGLGRAIQRDVRY
jgi:hypothetical protein